MLFLVLAWLYVFYLSLSYGALTWHLLKKLSRGATAKLAPEPEILSLLGICSLAWLVSIFSVFLPVNYLVHFIFNAGALLIIYFYWRFLKTVLFSGKKLVVYPLVFGGCVVLFAGLLLLRATDVPSFFDTLGYHAQFIQWVQQFKVVPGLGNLHGRLAFNSHFHVLSAFFSLPEVTAVPLHQSLGTYLLLLFIFFGFRKALQHFKTGSPLLIFYLGAVVWQFIGFQLWISSPMPDSAVSILILFTVALVLEENCYRFSETKTPDQSLVIFVLLASLITFKLSAAFLSLLLFYLFFRRQPKFAREFIGQAMLIFLLVLTPWLYRNVILSGHLLFPLPLLHLFHFDWEIPQAAVQLEQDKIVYFARWPAADWHQTFQFSLKKWLPFWWHHQEFLNRILLVATGFLMLLQGLFLSRNNFNQNRNLYLLFITCAGTCVCWFVSAPATRFGYGYLTATFLTGMLLFFRQHLPKPVALLAFALCLGYGINTIKNRIRAGNIREILVQPQPYGQVNTEQHLKAGIIFRTEPNNACWNAPIPCSETLPENLQLRGKTLQEGFRIEPKP